jgi:hypothetical protein
MPKKSNMLMNVLQAVAISISLGVLGALWKTYIDVHDLKLLVQDQKGKIDWLYKYNFPKMGERDGG